jgi:hypothetical protein
MLKIAFIARPVISKIPVKIFSGSVQKGAGDPITPICNAIFSFKNTVF